MPHSLQKVALNLLYHRGKAWNSLQWSWFPSCVLLLLKKSIVPVLFRFLAVFVSSPLSLDGIFRHPRETDIRTSPGEYLLLLLFVSHNTWKHSFPDSSSTSTAADWPPDGRRRKRTERRIFSSPPPSHLWRSETRVVDITRARRGRGDFLATRIGFIEKGNCG